MGLAKPAISLIILIAALLLNLSADAEQTASSVRQDATVDADGTFHAPAFAVPFSLLGSEEAKRSFIDSFSLELKGSGVVQNGAADARKEYDERYARPAIERVRKTFAVTITPEIIGGITTDVIMPEGGISAQNNNRVLINLHGGSFVYGARYGGQAESIPIAGLGKIKVITVDYRESPEYKFPAASEDVAVIYKELLRQYKPENVGIYGCSAGGILTSEAVAWFQVHHLPRPGAIGLFCHGAMAGTIGDSIYIGPALNYYVKTPSKPDAGWGGNYSPYFSESDNKSSLVSPAFSPSALKVFPPTLLITGTRDEGLSDIVYTHAQLVKAGVDAELHVWEGMRHGFLFYDDNSSPEASDAWNVIVRFFDKHLGNKRR